MDEKIQEQTDQEIGKRPVHYLIGVTFSAEDVGDYGDGDGDCSSLAGDNSDHNGPFDKLEVGEGVGTLFDLTANDRMDTSEDITPVSVASSNIANIVPLPNPSLKRKRSDNDDVAPTRGKCRNQPVWPPPRPPWKDINRFINPYGHLGVTFSKEDEAKEKAVRRWLEYERRLTEALRRRGLTRKLA